MNVVLLAEAKTDFLDGITWFESISPHLGDQFEFEFYSGINRISNNPEHFAVNELGFRACRLKKFTAVLHFRIDDEAVVIVRLLVNGREDRSLGSNG